jgi:hypothetical protein
VTPQDIIEAVRLEGGILAIAGEQVRVKAARPLSDNTMTELRRHKVEVISLLKSQNETPTDPHDNRRHCSTCLSLTRSGLCLAACEGRIKASPTYHPIDDIPRRCEGYKPRPVF